MKKTKTAKVFAILALLWIWISIVGTGILILTTPSQTTQETLSPEKLQEILKKSKVEATTVNTSSGETK